MSLLLIFAISVLFACSSGDNTDNSNEWETISADSSASNAAEEETRSSGPKEAPAPNVNPALTGSDVSKRMYKEYGAVFFSKNGAKPPVKVVFENESEVAKWQSSVPVQVEILGGVTVQLQKPAMIALLKAVEAGKAKGVSITPRGSDASRRDYAGTVSLWKSRVEPGLSYWVSRGRLSESEAQEVRGLGASAQIGKIFELERRGLFFSKDNSKSIIYSVAPPGTSQHISMLALDVAEHDNPVVRQLLADEGWFQTVISDTPHFTYLGLKQDQLGPSGLKKVSNGGRVYWVPAK